jgi:YjbE family integral membrane protein
LDAHAGLDLTGSILQIALIDLLLSGDNAVVIALACGQLPPAIRRPAIWLGTGGAVLLRVLLAFVATAALRAPLLKAAGALLLLLIALELAAGPRSPTAGRMADGRAGLWRAVLTILAADAIMSLDNVVAVAAAAHDQPLLLVFGLALSVPLLVFASFGVTRLLQDHPWLVMGGAALLGWVAGDTAVHDPLYARTLAEQSFGLVSLAPLLGALYVLVQGSRLRAARAAQAPAQPDHAGEIFPASAVPAAVLPAPVPSTAVLPTAALPDPVPPDPLPPDAVPTDAVPPDAAPADAALAGAAPSLTLASDAPASDALATEPVLSMTDEGLPAWRALLARASPMDLAVMAGVAVPLLAFVGMIFYLVGRAVFGGHAH